MTPNLVNPSDDAALNAADWHPQKRWLWPAALGFVILVAAALGWFFFVRAPQMRADRLLVALITEDTEGAQGIWWGARGRASARFVDQFSKNWDKMGLDLVAPADPDVLAKLENTATDEISLRGAASRFGAAHVLTGQLKLVNQQSLSPSELFDYTATLTLRLLPADPTLAPMDIYSEPPRFHTTGTSAEDALLALMAEVALHSFSPVAAALAQAPAIARLNQDASALDNADLAIAGRLDPVFRTAKLWHDQLALRAEEESREAGQENLDAGPLARKRLGQVLDEEYFVGTGSDGRLLVMLEPHYLQLLRNQGAYDLRRGHEQLVWVDSTTNARTPLLETYNIFSYPSVSADGKAVAAVLDRRQYSKALIVIDGANGTIQQLDSHESEYWSGPEISPRGNWVAVWWRLKRRAPSELRLYPTDGGAMKVLWGSDEARGFSVPSWAPDESALYVGVDQESERTSIWRIDIPSGKRTPLLGPAATATPAGNPSGDEASPDGDEESHDAPNDALEPSDADAYDEEKEQERGESGFDRPSISPDGSTLAVVEYGADGRWLGLFDLRTQEYRRVFEGRAQWPRWAPNSKRLAFETWRHTIAGDSRTRDTEIMLFDRATGATKPLTLNDVDDSVMGWSRDGSRVYFHQGSRDPDGDRWTNRIYWVEP